MEFYKNCNRETHNETVFSITCMQSFVEILVFGAGAVGSFFGGILSRRNDVTLIGRAEHIDAIRAHGLRISGKTSMMAKPHAEVQVPRGARPELIFVTTKAYDTGEAMVALRRFANRATFVTLQNGLGNAETIAKTARRVIAGTTTHGVTLSDPGHVRHAGVGETNLGGWAHVKESDVVRLRDLLADVGIVAEVTRDIHAELWSKLIINAAINPLGALAGVPNGQLVRDKRLLALLDAVCDEAVAAAAAEGTPLNAEEIRRRARLVARRTASNRGSMLQDLDRHRRTEIDAISGAIVQAADRHRIAVPINRALHALVRARESVH